MKASWYEQQGPAREVLEVGRMDDLEPAAGEIRIRVVMSGVHPGDVKKRANTFATGLRFPRVVPHSDGAGWVDEVGEGVDPAWVGKRVWCWGAQSGRPFGTAAELVVVPLERVSELADGVPFEEAASIGIPGITAHRAVDLAGELEGKSVLVQGAAGAVGVCAVHLARRRKARVLATVRNPKQQEVARRAGAHEVVLAGEGLESRLRAIAPRGIDHVIEVAFAANVEIDLALLKTGGSIATYATNAPRPEIPFWPLVFDNVRIDFLGSDDFPAEAKSRAARELSASLAEGWRPFGDFDYYPLAAIVEAHEQVERGQPNSKVIVVVAG
jgi:NADPH2:quinone reductase